MIHTITLNPSIDMTVRLERIRLGEAHALGEPLEDPGGKGMNAAIALRQLEMPVVAWVFLGGECGKRWIKLAQDQGVTLEPIWLESETRQNIKVFEEGAKRQTDFNFPGAPFEEKTCQEFLRRLSIRLLPRDFVVLAGSTLRGTPFSWWAELAQTIQAKECHLVVDMTGPGLQQIAKCAPWLIKINRDEFNDWYGLGTVSLNEVFASLQNRESLESHLIVTDGPHGALLWTIQRFFTKVPPIKVKVEGTVGAGDAFLAGWLTGWSRKEGDWEHAMRWGIATSAGAVELAGTRFPKLRRVQELLKKKVAL
jgi:1-phosphofructokinase